MNKKRIALFTITIAIVLFAFNAKDVYAIPATDSQPTFQIIDQSSDNISVDDINKIFNVTSTPSPYEQEKESFWAFLNQVAGINTQNYNVTYFYITSNTAKGSQKLQTSICATLSSGKEILGVAMVLIDGKVGFYDLNLVSGPLSGNTLDLDGRLKSGADALIKYQTNFDASYCKGLDEMVPKTMTEEKMTIHSGNTLLSVQKSTDENQVRNIELSWCKKIGDVAIPAQSIQAIVAKNGMLAFFVDNIGLYEVATTEIAVTNQDALDISMPIIEAFAKENGKTIEAIESKLNYVADYNGTRGDSYLVYPQWSISASFDDSDKSDVFGYVVTIWADSGQIHYQGIQANYQLIVENAPCYHYLNVICLCCRKKKTYVDEETRSY